MTPDEHGRLHSDALGVWLGVAEHTYAGVFAPWLRFFTDDGALIPTHAEAEAQRADAAERELAELKRQLAERG